MGMAVGPIGVNRDGVGMVLWFEDDDYRDAV